MGRTNFQDGEAEKPLFNSHSMVGGLSVIMVGFTEKDKNHTNITSVSTIHRSQKGHALIKL